MDNKLSEEQELALKETLEMGVAFEEMATTKGWKYIVAYYQNQIASFMNDVMSGQPLEDLNEKRAELMGIKKLLSQVDNAISTWQKERDGKSA